ncbi:MAG TPA: hypothetical protein EYP03_02015 [Aquificae bacterium]|nr:hypothetical protein [Aquificota bacterium]
MEENLTYIDNINLDLNLDFTQERRLDNKTLENIAKEIRKIILKATTRAKSGHPGGSLSSTDIITYLYFEFLKHNPQNPKWPLRVKWRNAYFPTFLLIINPSSSNLSTNL